MSILTTCEFIRVERKPQFDSYSGILPCGKRSKNLNGECRCNHDNKIFYGSQKDVFCSKLQDIVSFEGMK